jgi:molybdopterin-containing oxidoreductase family iron-sulfur binding subunit
MHLMHRNGRVTKAEGNPEHPINHGALCPRGQSSLQGLYDPDRLRLIIRRDKNGHSSQSTWDEAVTAIAAQLQKAEGRLAVVSQLETGTLAEIMQTFTETFGSKRLLLYERFDYEPIKKAHDALFGRPLIPDYRLEESEFIISFAADFLETWISPVQFARAFAKMRTYENGKIGRHIYIGPRLSMTAANADEFIQVNPADVPLIALAMLAAIIKNGWAKKDVGRILSDIDTVSVRKALPPGISEKKLDQWAKMFVEAKGSVALAGPVGADSTLARQTALAAALLNYAAGRNEKTVDFRRAHALTKVNSNEETLRVLSALTREDVLIIYQANPVYNLPESQKYLKQAGMLVYLGTLLDETAALADWVLPVDSPLEIWGDYEPYEGIHSLMQPTMNRLHATYHPGDVLLTLARVAGKPLSRKNATAPANTFEDWLHGRWQELHSKLSSSEPFDEFWRNSLRRGYIEEEPKPVKLELNPQESISLSIPRMKEELKPNAAHLWVWPHIMLFDGRLANRGWMQENPEPVAYITWGSWIEIHPAKARQLKIEHNQVLELQTETGMIQAPARVTSDIAEDVVAIALGQGHTALGGLAAGRGANAFQLLPAQNPNGEVFLQVTIRPLDKSLRPTYFSRTQDQHERGIMNWVELSQIPNLKYAEKRFDLPLPEGYHPTEDLYAPHEHKKHRWAMVIDLHRCIGCGACAVACYAENNIAVVGQDQVNQGLEMAWLKLVPYREDGNQMRLGFLPMLCQHCDAAPCEPVCPVYAAAHNEEGLNMQIYNRCVGTRYCSNNCPYKVRRFNWSNHDWPKSLALQLNPEVTVRSRGVMEKCTFCIQRIRMAQNRAKLENRQLKDGDIQPACAQTCPTRTIIFGDLLDPNSQVSRLTRNDLRRYHVLEDRNTKPGIAYLYRIKATEENRPE